MNPYPLKSLADVYLYQLHKTNLPGNVNAGILSFSDLWGMAVAAAANVTPRLSVPNLSNGGVYDPMEKQAVKDFACSILMAVDELERLGYVARHTKDGGEKLDRITLTTAGTAFIASVIFTDQTVAGVYERPAPRRSAPRRGRSYSYLRGRGTNNFPTRY